MASTTTTKVKLTAPEIELSDEALELLISDASLSVEEKKFPEKYQEVATRYLAAHLATHGIKNVVSEQVGSLKREYSDKNPTAESLQSTVYGQEYSRLEKLHARRGGGLKMVVI